MESEQIMRKWAARRGWSALTKEMLVYAFLDELGMETLGLFDEWHGDFRKGRREIGMGRSRCSGFDGGR